MLAENTDNGTGNTPAMMDFTPEEIQYALQFERTLRELEAHLHNTDDPEVIAKDMLVAATEFYDGDWCGIFDVDLTTSCGTKKRYCQAVASVNSRPTASGTKFSSQFPSIRFARKKRVTPSNT